VVGMPLEFVSTVVHEEAASANVFAFATTNTDEVADE
jgi:hypothetical protein